MTQLDEAARRLAQGSLVPPHLYAIGPHDARAALSLMQAPPQEAAQRVSVPTPHGPITVRVLTPAGPQTRPVLLYVHGGGWMTGGWATHHRLATALSREVGAVVVVPEYTRTPEARHPVAVEQIAATLAWVRSGGLGEAADPDRVATVGDCAGATLALTVALGERDRLRGQALLYPMVRPDPADPSAQQFATGAVLRLVDVQQLWRSYAPGEPGSADPMAARELTGLPPTLLITAEADVTRDRTERFGDRMRRAGVAVTAVRYLGTVHDFAVLDTLRWTPAAQAALTQTAHYLRGALGVSS